ncbi:hypothetical protein KY289_008024 [Solanum tuberosum]|nr:hypothetical protein KY289_008024 [Solanum tuberosum]
MALRMTREMTKSIRIALLGKMKYDFVTNACTRALYKYELHEQWKTCNAHLKERFDKLKTLWGEYDAVVPNPSCVCPQSKDYVDHLHQLRLIQFLSGLNESYEKAHRQILLKGVTPFINQAYVMIIKDEIQHSSYMENVVLKPDLIVMNVYKNQGGNTKGNEM